MIDNIDTGDEQTPISDSPPPEHRLGMRPVAALLLVILLLTVAAFIWVAVGNNAGNTSAGGLVATGCPKVGSVAPDFALADVRTGQSFTLASLRGRPVWINFWATWCPPCKTELPIMKQKYDKYKAQGLAIVGIDMQEEPAYVKSYVDGNAFDWTFVVDPDGAVTDRYYTAGIPSHLFIDESGVIRAINVGDLQEPSMEILLGTIMRPISSQTEP
ncbi:MAG: TlpA disulfide reductase family protein [Chloroflexota bacterium]